MSTREDNQDRDKLRIEITDAITLSAERTPDRVTSLASVAARAVVDSDWLRDHDAQIRQLLRQAIVEEVRRSREAFLPSVALDEAWIAGWHSATDHIAGVVAPL